LYEVGKSKSIISLHKTCKYIIYGLREPGTNEIRYIGKSSNSTRRPRSHWKNKKYLRDGYPVHVWTSSLVKQNIFPEIILLAEFPGLELAALDERNSRLNETEIQLILTYRTLGHKLLNMTDGGDGLLGRTGKLAPMYGRRGILSPRFGVQHTEESRIAMSEALSGENHPHFGKHPSEITRNKIGEANKGSNNGMFGKNPVNKGLQMKEEQKELLREKCGSKIRCINDGRIFRSQVETACFYGISRITVGQCCNRKIKKTINGLCFEFI